MYANMLQVSFCLFFNCQGEEIWNFELKWNHTTQWHCKCGKITVESYYIQKQSCCFLSQRQWYWAMQMVSILFAHVLRYMPGRPLQLLKALTFFLKKNKKLSSDVSFQKLFPEICFTSKPRFIRLENNWVSILILYHHFILNYIFCH